MSLLLAVAAGALSGILFSYYLNNSRYSVEVSALATYRPPQVTTIYADDGETVAYDKLLSDIAALRSRVAAVTTTLFSSKLRVLVGVEGDDARIASFRITLDDGVVYSAPERFGSDEPQVVYEHAVAPGHHVVGVEIERYDARNKEFRTWQSSRFSVVVPESKLVDAHLTVVDDSDMAEDFPDDQDGEYDLRVKLRARVEE